MSEETKVVPHNNVLSKMKSILFCFKEKSTCSDHQNEEEVYNESHELLPHDVITMHILTRLPIKSVLRFKLVSKLWCSTLSSYRFADAHFKVSSLINNPFAPSHCMIIQKNDNFYVLTDIACGGSRLFLLRQDFRESVRYDEGNVAGYQLSLVGSCNGLVCVGSFCDFLLWNPVTGRYKKFYSNDLDEWLNLDTPYQVSWGFGYVSSTNDYKVVRIIELPVTLEIIVHVFSMKSNCWRRIDPREYDQVISLSSFKSAVNMCDQHFLFHTNFGVLCDGKVNWIVVKPEVWDKRVVSFDLVNETFETNRRVELPPPASEVYLDRFICVMRGCLSIYGVSMRGDACVSVYERSREGYQWKESIRLSRDLGLASCTDLIDLSSDGIFAVQKGNTEIGVVNSNLQPMTYRRLLSIEEWGNMYLMRHFPSLVVPIHRTCDGCSADDI